MLHETGHIAMLSGADNTYSQHHATFAGDAQPVPVNYKRD
ncbi:hypothetical protein Pvag_pPag30169 (plasmid) [Pantoea vagans C9-1]|nr:hypothetical protein Pvag_pPag30169 [Pantoea vagans C9-1]